MEVTLAKHAGFCGGVQRAFDLVEKEFGGKENSNVLILGSLAHNENVMARVFNWGIKKIDDLKEVKTGDTVIITAHGVGEDVIQEVKSKGAEIFDTTCPKVSQVHKSVKDYYQKGFEVIIFGDKLHKEVIGTNGWCERKAAVISDLDEAKKLLLDWKGSENVNPVLIVSQTTQNIDDYRRITEFLVREAKLINKKVEVKDTICLATIQRQPEAKKISLENEAIVVVGGKKSANTKRLWLIAKEQKPEKTIWIEDLNEETKLEMRNVLEGAKKVGVLSGASTPRWDIKKVVEFLKAI